MVAFNQFSTKSEVDAGVIENAVIVSLSVGAPAVLDLDGELVGPNRLGIVSPSRRLTVHRAAESGVLVLRAGFEAVAERFRELTGSETRRKSRLCGNVRLTRLFALAKRTEDALASARNVRPYTTAARNGHSLSSVVDRTSPNFVPLPTSPKKLWKMSLETGPTTQWGHSYSVARIHVYRVYLDTSDLVLGQWRTAEVEVNFTASQIRARYYPTGSAAPAWSAPATMRNISQYNYLYLHFNGETTIDNVILSP